MIWRATMKDKTIVYFGTIYKGSGHTIEVISGGFTNYEEEHNIACALDRFDTYKDVLGYFISNDAFFGTFNFSDCTIFGCLRSPHDDRLGSKTLVAIFGEKLCDNDMITIIKNNLFLKKQFTLLCEKYNQKNIFS